MPVPLFPQDYKTASAAGFFHNLKSLSRVGRVGTRGGFLQKTIVENWVRNFSREPQLKLRRASSSFERTSNTVNNRVICSRSWTRLVKCSSFISPSALRTVV